jgi:predicted Rossmann fold nucleotide-binding protein DprA/Smf involved in DNA uptake
LTVDTIARIVGMPVFRLSPILLQMELAGMITPCPGNVYRIRMS